MKITFLWHSGFLVETESVLLLFDWWKGGLPALPEKPLIVFASHHHPDHFNPEIFGLDIPQRTVRFVLGKDIRLAPANRKRWKLTEETAAKCTRLGGFRHKEILPGVLVETLPSTDEGVAFIVTADGKTIYHAGDLNRWYWAEEGEEWNRKMELDFKQFTAPLKNRKLTLAMAPLDSRMEQGAELGFEYLLQLAEIEKIIPMHQWGDFTATERYLQKHPERKEQVLRVEKEGQVFRLL